MARQPLYPHVPKSQSQGKFIIKMDRTGSILINHNLRPGKDVFLQMESDKELVTDLMSNREREDLGHGWTLEIPDREPRASTLSELWEVSATEKKLPPGDIVIQDRYGDPNHKIVKIYRGGRVYAATYAQPFPTKESAMKDYFENPKSFEPYDESTGRYV